MYDKVMELYPACDIVFKTAAVGDYRPETYHDQKIKKGSSQLVLTLVKNPDILQELGKRKKEQILVGFAAETQNVAEYAREKMQQKNLDFILANDITESGAGFMNDTNKGVLITHEGEIVEIPLLDKNEFAHRMIDEVLKRSPRLAAKTN